MVNKVEYSIEDIFKGIKLFLEDYLGDSVDTSVKNVFKVDAPENSAIVKLNIVYKSKPIDIEFLTILPDKEGAYLIDGKQHYSPLVLVEKREFLKTKNTEAKIRQIDFENFFVVPGYFLEKALKILRALRGKEAFIKNMAQVTTEKKAEKVFASNLSAVLSNTYVGARLYELLDGRWIKVPILFPLSNDNELLRLSELRKVVYHGSEVSEEFRIQHESHLGRVDLLETPESEAIGRVLYLASGAHYDAKKLQIIPANTKKVEDILSPSTRSVPFFNHSDSTRTMMGGKNLKQAVKVSGAEEPIIKTGIEKEVDMRVGVNAFVGYSLYYGLNYEDGIIVSDKFAEKMSIERVETFSFDEYIPIPGDIKITKNDNTLTLSSGEILVKYKFPNIGTKLVFGDKVCERKVYLVKNKKPEIIKDLTFECKYKDRYPAIMSESPTEDWLSLKELRKWTTVKLKNEKEEIELNNSKFELKIPLKVHKPLEVGDKITGRHGNKGTISRILPESEMPYVEISGKKRHLEMILSPLGIITRMNLGQLLETQGSLAGIKDGSPEKVNIDAILKALKKLGSDDFGRFELHLGNSKFPAAVGYQYFVRLNHNVRDKLHVVSKAKVSSYSYQPLKGKKKMGGQRIGEMEFWTLFDHNSPKVIELFSKTNLKNWKDSKKYINNFNFLLSALEGIKLEKERDINGLKLKVTAGYSLTNLKAQEEKLSKEISPVLFEKVQSLLKLKRLKTGPKDKKDYFKKAIKDLLASKDGYIRKHMLGRRIHYSGRATIVPATDIDVDHVYLPVDFALEWFSKLRPKSYSKRDILEGNLDARKSFAKAVNDYVESEDIYILLNRQPSLHMHSIQSSRPVFWEHYAIGLPIMLCEGFGADFDGDTMAVYYPVEQRKLKDELEKMLPSNHPFRIGNGELIFSCEQDVVYGHYVLTEKRETKKEAKHSLVNAVMKSRQKELPKTLLDWQTQRLNAATEGGLSLSFFEAAKGIGYMREIIESQARGKKENFEQIFGSLKIAGKYLGNFAKGIPIRSYFGLKNTPFENSIAVRGRKSMLDKKLHVAGAGYFTRKMVEFLYPVRITLDDCGTSHGIEISREFVKQLEQNGYSLERLILGRYVRLPDEKNWQLITRENISELENKDFVLRSPVFCKEENGICSKCAGTELSTKFLPYSAGEYIGVKAGHSIGERGTQLSMKTFQLGITDFKMDKVSKEFFNRGTVSDYKEYLLKLSQKTISEIVGVSGNSGMTDKKLFEMIDISSIYLEVLFAGLLKNSLQRESEVKSMIMNPKKYGAFAALSFENVLSVVKMLVNSKEDEYIELSPKSYYALCEELLKGGRENG
ncbi:hypothetical protein AT15_00020 [Kosmotoga arenicorallina S304]|uniref:DNA-directed RNA polymerase n=1 Tax=Kosmotoga arenicorallina S304 TaxID=1453497 RepID=A0A182C8P0_9BACT|nr:hypothetical protein [Kosmotoga arenicorallina]OAA32499.1 hypothetical protein AT15_00020 [Kosmotoga arenicorallina S304]